MFREPIDAGGEDDRAADDDGLGLPIELHDNDAVDDEIDDPRAQERSECSAAAAEERGSPDDGGRDDTKFVALAVVGGGGVEASEVNEGGDAGTEAHDDVDAEVDPPDAYAG